AIASVITSADSLAVVWPKFILDVLIGENANLLKPATGKDTGKIHGWMIGNPAEGNTRIGSVNRFESDATVDNTAWRLETTLTFPIWFLHFYDNEADSDKLFDDIRESVVEKFARKPRLAIEGSACGTANHIRSHRELQAGDRPTIVKMGAEWAHWCDY